VAPTTPEEWLPVLAKRLEARRPRIKRLRDYTTGNAPLPEMGKNTRATWAAFQKKARTDFGGIAVRSHVNRIKFRGVRVGADSKSDIALAARKIIRNNRLKEQIRNAVRDMEAVSVGYLVGYVDGDGSPLIQAEKPESFYAEPDPVRPWRARAGIKTWRDDVEMVDHAMVWAGPLWQEFVRQGTAFPGLVSASGPWWPVGSPQQTAGWDYPPISILDRDDGLALIEAHTDVIDRINLGKLQRLCIVALQVFRQRALKKSEDAPPMATVDPETGEPIDWEAIFEPAPGALWDLPEGVEIWESQTTAIEGLLQGEKADARDFGATVGTPMAMLQPDNANQSAAGAAATTAQQADACDADIDRIKIGIEARMLDALRLLGFTVEDTIEADFENPRWVTLAEKMDAYQKAIASGMSIETAQREILGWSQEQIDEDAANRTRTQALSALSALAPTG
jgi:hypothetical protein